MEGQILAISWLRQWSNRFHFIAGSDEGSIFHFDLTKSWGSKPVQQFAKQRIENQNPVVGRYPSFDRLTSVHTNCTDEFLLTSKYLLNGCFTHL